MCIRKFGFEASCLQNWPPSSGAHLTKIKPIALIQDALTPFEEHSGLSTCKYAGAFSWLGGERAKPTPFPSWEGGDAQSR